MTFTDPQLLDASREIGCVVESAQWFSDLVTARLASLGGDVNALTVGQLREIIAQCRQEARS